MAFKCSRCDVEVEDEGLCVKCWDEQISNEARDYKRRNPEKVKAIKRAWQRKWRARKRGQ